MEWIVDYGIGELVRGYLEDKDWIVGSGLGEVLMGNVRDKTWADDAVLVRSL